MRSRKETKISNSLNGWEIWNTTQGVSQTIYWKGEKLNTEKKLQILEAQLKQVSAYYIPPDKKSTSTKMGMTSGVSNSVMVNWKNKRIEELTKEVENLKAKK